MKPRNLVFFVCGAMLALGPRAVAQQSRCVFDAANVQLDASVPPFRRMLDFDLDGDPDAVGAQFTTNNRDYRLYAYENDGEGVFERVWNSAVNTGLTSAVELLIEVGRVNTDPWPDVVVVYRGLRQDWLGNGNGSFAAQPTTILPAVASALALADLDGDSIDDVIWADTISLHVATSSGASGSIAALGPKYGLRVLPRDGPGSTDVFLVHVGNEVQIFHGSPAGLSAGPVLYHGVGSSMMDAGDVDGDGDVDAVVFGPASYRVLRRSAPDAWTPEPLQTGGPAEFLRDVDGDGDLDGVCCGGGGGGGGGITYPNNVQPSEFQVALNDGLGNFAPSFTIRGVGSPQLAGALDVDGDGDVDLVAGRCVVFSRGAIGPPAGFEYAPPVRGRRDLSDCDLDGDVDVGFSVDRVYANDGVGGFSEEPMPVSAPPAGLYYEGPGFPGDFDGDGDVDLLVELRRAGRAQRFLGDLPGHGSAVEMALLPNDGSGALLPPLPASERGVSFALGSLSPDASLLVDPDLDGDLDLLTRSARNPGATRLWTNQGFGYFRAGGLLDGERAAWAGDVDLDGDLDLITSGPELYSVEAAHLYLGSEPVPGRLPTLTLSNSLGWRYRVESGISETDFDQNGYPDFGIVTWSTGATEVLALNNIFYQGGELTANLVLDSDYDLTSPSRLELGDLDGDSIADALVGPHDGEQVSISEVHVKHDVGLATLYAFDMVLQLVPAGLLVDLDGDGDLDVLGDRIVLNRSLP